MAVAAMLGSACGTNTANMNDCNPGRYNECNHAQNVCYQKGGQDLEQILSRKGVSFQTGNSRCGLNQGCNGGSCPGSK